MIYLDNAATSFIKPRCVYEATINAMVNNSANAGRGGYNAAISSNEILFNTRENLATLFNIQNPERISFCYNTTHALNLGIKGVLSYGDHVIISSMEHNSVLRPIKALEKQKRISVSIVQANEKGEIDEETIKHQIRPNTKLICMTHSSNVCGSIVDIEKTSEIAHSHNALFMVDSAQSAGSLDIDASKLDLLAFPGHKGLMGPMGTGGLYVRDGIELNTILEGGTGSLSESSYQPDFMPDRLESGTQNIPAIAGLGSAVEFILKTGIKNIREREEYLLKMFEERIKEIKNVTIYGSDNKTSICALNIKNADCVEVAGILNERYDIAVRAGLHCSILAHKTLGTDKTGCVRFSFGYFNTEEEVIKAADAVYQISKEF
ncbi:MAG: aminotransferase class V-fold PLP-dependent enzyme [Clostridia bacterium]|nr:aminotransferase class V-fold PLP-dependent enzyme [Clostridia bacterium]